MVYRVSVACALAASIACGPDEASLEVAPQPVPARLEAMMTMVRLDVAALECAHDEASQRRPTRPGVAVSQQHAAHDAAHRRCCWASCGPDENMSISEKPWLSFPRTDDEGHMEAVGQTNALRSLLADVYATAQPARLAVLGCTTGADVWGRGRDCHGIPEPSNPRRPNDVAACHRDRRHCRSGRLCAEVTAGPGNPERQGLRAFTLRGCWSRKTCVGANGAVVQWP